MTEYLKSECPHCGQPVEYPADGTGQEVACPSCQRPFVLTPMREAKLEPVLPPTPEAAVPPKISPADEIANPPAISSPKVLISSAISPPDVPKTMVAKAAGSPSPKPDRFDLACLEFEGGADFGGRTPTREQVARAWALVVFRKSSSLELPSHVELVAALKELFSEFKDPRRSVVRSVSDKSKSYG